MAVHQAECDICEQLAQCREGTHPRLIAELDSGFAVLGANQYFRGYSLLLCKEPATELDELEPWLRAQFLSDMARLAHAVRLVMEPHKLNLALLGNLVHHLHWHVHPRYVEEPRPDLPVWQCMPSTDEESATAFDPLHDNELIHALRDALNEPE